LVYSTKTALTTVIATAILYNILLKQHDVMPQNDQQDENHLLGEIPAAPENQVGNIVRNKHILASTCKIFKHQLKDFKYFK